MSLTQILKHPVRKNLKSWFKYHFPNPDLEEKLQILVSPSPNPNPSEVGTALDYLIRFSKRYLSNIDLPDKLF